MKTLHLVVTAVILACLCVLVFNTSVFAQSTGYMTGSINSTAYLWTFNTSTNVVTGQHTLGNNGTNGTGQFALSKNGTLAYLPQINQLTVLDLSTFASVATIPFAGESDGAVALSPDGSTLYLASITGNVLTNGTISVINASTFAVTGTITVGKGAVSIAFDPSGAKAYVLNYYDNSVSVIDVPSSSVVTTLSLPSGLAGVFSIAALKRNSGFDTQLLVGTSQFNSSNNCSEGTQPGELLVYDAVSLSLLNTVSVANGCPYSILTPFSDTAFVVTEGNFQAGGKNGTFYSYSATAGGLTHGLPLDCKPFMGAASVNTSHGFAVSHYGSGNSSSAVDVINLSTGAAIGRMAGIPSTAVIQGLAAR